MFMCVYTVRHTVVRRSQRQALHASAAVLLNMWPGDPQGRSVRPEWMAGPQSQSRPPGGGRARAAE